MVLYSHHILFLKNIKCLLPGYILKVNINGKILENKSFCSGFNNTHSSNQFYEKNIIDLVKRYYFADVPVGVFLSGGYDSTLLAFLASRISKNRINTFNLKFSENPIFRSINKQEKYLKS